MIEIVLFSEKVSYKYLTFDKDVNECLKGVNLAASQNKDVSVGTHHPTLCVFLIGL